MKTLLKSLVMGAAFVAAVEATASDANETCMTYYEFAETVMSGRQSGVPMPDMMAVVEGEEVLVSIIRAAYRQPRMNVEENQQRYITDFANETYAECLEAFD